MSDEKFNWCPVLSAPTGTSTTITPSLGRDGTYYHRPTSQFCSRVGFAINAVGNRLLSRAATERAIVAVMSAEVVRRLQQRLA